MSVVKSFGCLLVTLAVGVGGCGGDSPNPNTEPTEKACVAAEGEAPDFLSSIGCRKDFDALSSEPLDTSIPGARSVKVVLDRLDNDTLYFQNSKKYQIHHQFAQAKLSGQGKPIVGSLADFNKVQYFAPDRRFILAAVTYYEQPKLWTLEFAPYDSASAEMVTKLFEKVAAAGYFGSAMVFHPTSEPLAAVARALPSKIKSKSNDEIYATIDYQPLNLATAYGRLRFMKAAELEKAYVSFRDIVVLDNVPNDISVVMGIITEEFQTPLSHVNVLSQNRKTPNMGLRNATSNPMLRALDGKWVKLTVGATSWTVAEVTSAEAETFWNAHKPVPVVLPAVDMSVTELKNIEDIVIEKDGVPLRDAIKAQIGAWGGKAAHFSILAKTDGVPTPKAFAIPAYHYVKFMTDHGLFAKMDGFLADPEFKDKPEVRDARLKAFRKEMKTYAIDPQLQNAIKAKLGAEYPNTSMRFRTSTNSEDLEGFPCAGCYESHTGNANDWVDTWDAITETWASIWLFRTFEERSYNSIDHKSVVMALLVHHNFPDEEANGVALTANPFDATGAQPGFFVNVQFGGEAEVVHPPPGVTSDQFIFSYNQPGKPISYLSHSNLVAMGSTVLTPLQVNELGNALEAVHKRFSAAYGPQAGNNGWYAMDVEFKFDGEPGKVPKAVIKQARPHPGRGK